MRSPLPPGREGFLRAGVGAGDHLRRRRRGGLPAAGACSDVPLAREPWHGSDDGRGRSLDSGENRPPIPARLDHTGHGARPMRHLSQPCAPRPFAAGIRPGTRSPRPRRGRGEQGSRPATTGAPRDPSPSSRPGVFHTEARSEHHPIDQDWFRNRASRSVDGEVPRARRTAAGSGQSRDHLGNASEGGDGRGPRLSHPRMGRGPLSTCGPTAGYRCCVLGAFEAEPSIPP